MIQSTKKQDDNVDMDDECTEKPKGWLWNARWEKTHRGHASVASCCASSARHGGITECITIPLCDLQLTLGVGVLCNAVMNSELCVHESTEDDHVLAAKLGGVCARIHALHDEQARLTKLFNEYDDVQ